MFFYSHVKNNRKENASANYNEYHVLKIRNKKFRGEQLKAFIWQGHPLKGKRLLILLFCLARLWDKTLGKNYPQTRGFSWAVHPLALPTKRRGGGGGVLSYKKARLHAGWKIKKKNTQVYQKLVILCVWLKVILTWVYKIRGAKNQLVFIKCCLDRLKKPQWWATSAIAFHSSLNPLKAWFAAVPFFIVKYPAPSSTANFAFCLISYGEGKLSRAS